MKKYYILLVSILLLFPINVKAFMVSTDNCDTYNTETKTCKINICKNDCNFSSISNIPNFGNSVNTLIINLEKDEYNITNTNLYFLNINKTIINGNGSILLFEDEENNEISIRGKQVEINNLTMNMIVDIEYSDTVILDFITVKDSPTTDEALNIIYPSQKVQISNSIIPGLYISVDYSIPISINNSDLRTDNRCSIEYSILNMPLNNVSKGTFNYADYNVRLLEDLQNKKIQISNSKLSCASCGTQVVGDSAIIEIDATNEWKDGVIDRGTNVLERTDNAYIYVEQSDKDTVTINTVDDLTLNNYFELDEDFSISWEVEDEEIARIDNNKIIPLKVGSTIIRARQGHDIYTLRLDVTDDMINPTPTPTATPIVTPSPSPAPTNNVEVPDTYHTGLFIIIAAIFTVIPVTYYFISKEEE